MKYNYKCVVAKNDSKMYYKRISGKWKRITNKAGEKVEKGRKKYRMYSGVTEPHSKQKLIFGNEEWVRMFASELQDRGANPQINMNYPIVGLETIDNYIKRRFRLYYQLFSGHQPFRGHTYLDENHNVIFPEELIEWNPTMELDLKERFILQVLEYYHLNAEIDDELRRLLLD